MAGRVYQLKVTLRWIEPPIWRRFVVPWEITLKELHQILQAMFDWGEDLLHEFTIHGDSYGGMTGSHLPVELDDMEDDNFVVLRGVVR